MNIQNITPSPDFISQALRAAQARHAHGHLLCSKARDGRKTGRIAVDGRVMALQGIGEYCRKAFRIGRNNIANL
jgi:hypothetical protein